MRALRLFLLALAASSASFAADLTSLQIHVTNDLDKPVDNASVIVKFVEGRSITKLGTKIRKSWEVRTTQEGMAKIPDIPKGKILIQVIAKNYQTFGDYVQVDEDQRTVDIKLNRPQKQYSTHAQE